MYPKIVILLLWSLVWRSSSTSLESPALAKEPAQTQQRERRRLSIANPGSSPTKPAGTNDKPSVSSANDGSAKSEDSSSSTEMDDSSSTSTSTSSTGSSSSAKDDSSTSSSTSTSVSSSSSSGSSSNSTVKPKPAAPHKQVLVDEIPGNYTANNTKLYPDLQDWNVTVTANATAPPLFPEEPDQPTGWPAALLSIFLGLGIFLCLATAIKQCRHNHKGYEEIPSSLTV